MKLVVPMPQIKIPPLFLLILKKKKDDTKFKKFLAFSNLSVNIPLLESLNVMPGYAKFMKELITKQRVMDFKTIEICRNYSAILSSTMVVKKAYLGTFIISCTIGVYKFKNGMFDVAVSINFMSFIVF